MTDLDMRDCEYVMTTGISVGFPIYAEDDDAVQHELMAAVMQGQWRDGARHPAGVVVVIPTQAVPTMMLAFLGLYLSVATSDQRVRFLADVADEFGKAMGA